MANPGQIKTYDASGAIPAYSVVKFTATDFQVTLGAAVSDKLCGITTEVAAVDGERCDVIHDGIAYASCGGTVAAGDPLTVNATGQVVTAAPAAGTNNNCIGRARQSGVSGDVIEVIVDFFVYQG